MTLFIALKSKLDILQLCMVEQRHYSVYLIYRVRVHVCASVNVCIGNNLRVYPSIIEIVWKIVLSDFDNKKS